MNLLIDIPPKTVWVDGVQYEINSDFRTSILFEIMMFDAELEGGEKVNQMLELYYHEVPGNLQEAAEAIFWFYKCGKDLKENDANGNIDGRRRERIYSFEHDDSYIYAAFLEQYGVDLNDIEYLHWWKFKALFEALKEDCKMSKIMGYRAVEIRNDMGRGEKEFYKKMKDIHRIPVQRDENEKLSQIEEALLNGGDLRGVL